jgi:hypothetical protein
MACLQRVCVLACTGFLAEFRLRKPLLISKKIDWVHFCASLRWTLSAAAFAHSLLSLCLLYVTCRCCSLLGYDAAPPRTTTGCNDAARAVSPMHSMISHHCHVFRTFILGLLWCSVIGSRIMQVLIYIMETDCLRRSRNSY